MITEAMAEKKRLYESIGGKEAYYPEHSTSVDDLVYNVHSPGIHGDEDPCTVHNMSEHPLRWWPQRWLSRNNSSPDEIGMWRICQHGVKHPDPDDPIVTTTHDCDSCCAQEYPESFPTHLLNAENKKLKELVKKEKTLQGDLSILTPKRKAKAPSIAIHSQGQGLLLQIVVATKGEAASYAPVIAHAEDVELPQGKNTLKGLRLSAYTHEELEVTPLSAYAGSALYPQENNDGSNPRAGEGYLLCLSIIFQDEKGDEFTSRVSFLMDALDGFTVAGKMIPAQDSLQHFKALEEFYLE